MFLCHLTVAQLRLTSKLGMNSCNTGQRPAHNDQGTKCVHMQLAREWSLDLTIEESTIFTKLSIIRLIHLTLDQLWQMHAQMRMLLIPQQISQLQRNEHQSVAVWDPECSLSAYRIHVGTCGIGSMSIQRGYHTRHMLCIRGVLWAILSVVVTSK